MIVFEDGIKEIINQMPTILGFNARFHWGNEDELNRYISLVKQPYPLVWLIVGSESHNLKDSEITRNTRFILATRESNVNKLNDVRLTESFDKVLNPLVDRLIEGIQKSDRTDFPDRKIDVFKYPNYSGYDEGSKSESKNKTIDLWDAVTISANVRMNNNCQNTIKWQNRN